MVDWTQRRPGDTAQNAALARRRARADEERENARCGKFHPQYDLSRGSANFCAKAVIHKGPHANRQGECWNEGDTETWKPGERKRKQYGPDDEPPPIDDSYGEEEFNG